MESQPGVVVAAEALRGWIRTQRTTWTEPAREKSAVGFLPPAALESAPLVDLAPFVEDPAIVPWVPTPSRRLGGAATRVAAGLALVAALAGVAVGGRVAWSRYRSTPKTGTATFTSQPAGAGVFVDGQPVGTTPVDVELQAGAHAVEFRLNAATRTQAITVLKGRQSAFSVNWNAKRFGGVQVDSTPDGARVLVDGRERGVTPLTLRDVVVGPHTVQIDSSEGSVRRRIEVVEGKTEAINESIYSGWLHVSAPIDISVIDGTTGVQLDDSNRVLLKPGAHSLRIENQVLDFSVARQVQIEPGGTTEVSVEVPSSTLTVTGSSGAAVFVDGTKAGETPLTEFPVKLGSRDIMVVDRSGATRHKTLTVTTRPAQLEISFAHP